MATPNWFLGFPFRTDLDLGPLPPRVRGYAPEDRHITLAFLGPVEAEAAHEAWIESEGLDVAPFDATLGPVEMLGHPRRPSAVSATLLQGRAEAEAAIAAHRARLLERAGARPDPRPPLAHVTVARVQRKASPIHFRDAARWASALRLKATARVESVALYTRSADRTKRRFDVVDERPLTGVGLRGRR